MRVSRQILWLVIILLLVTNVFTLLFFQPNDSTGPKVDTLDGNNDAIATVAGQEITYEQWIQYLIEHNGQDALETMTNRAAVSTLAEEKGLSVSDKIIEREISRLMATQDVLTEKEKQAKIEQWEKEITHRYLLQKLLAEQVDVTEAEIASYYQTYQEQYNFDQMVQLSHITVATQQTAEELYNQLENGESFVTLAEQYSTDEETATDGGYLGYYTETSSFISDRYFQEAHAIEEGNYSQPFSSAEGFSIIYVHERLPSVSFTLEEVHSEVEADISLDRLEQNVDAKQLWEQLEVETIYQNE
ncbi:protein secretion protein [Gracilibacillus halophilus YIM-C55.5]|uniref:peptidylprolyl isomerase n=1 Tax=Gracilibacillus halophilus YIM-C55.5 TaxID=1308866 RepID=N4WNE1_9BACI|nr:peptidylprolyl isomerase [Gracilibacillus halophilus]ENH97642.1 protein secretion protein [Gracilibacillus halophilus YIM-C55.5]